MDVDPVDVALTFLSEDEPIALKIADELRDRVDVFFYADRQAELVGTDGEESFGEVFRDRARIVVVFYRTGWGETMMTRAEKSAIKQRAAREGYGFTIWVMLDPEKVLPSFVDPQHIWFDYHRWGVSGLASVIEQKLRDAGKETRPRSFWDEMQLAATHLDQTALRSGFKGQSEALTFVQDERRRIESHLRQTVTRLDELSPNVGFSLKVEGRFWKVYSYPYCCTFWFEDSASNTARPTRLCARLNRDDSKRIEQSKWRELALKLTLAPSLDPEGKPCWEADSGQQFDLESAVQHMFSGLAHTAIKEREDAIRREHRS